MEENNYNFNKIKDSINYIVSNFKNQPSLDDIAENVNLSPFHFQKIFNNWAGISPKKFLQFISLNHAKYLLKENNSNLFNTTFDTGLSSSSRLHDLFVKIEGMTPFEYKNRGKNLIICYLFTESIFGKLLIASTQKGICSITFIDNENDALQLIKQQFPNAQYFEKKNEFIEKALHFFTTHFTEIETIKLHLKGTDFQIKVWEALLKIPMGKVTSYGKLAETINNKNASRAVGSAIGKNPIAFLIPCHRVIQASGNFGEYMWGFDRKAAIIGWEGAKTNNLLA